MALLWKMFHWPELLGEMINCRAARVGPSQRVETRPRAALSCAASQHFFLLGLPQLKSEAAQLGRAGGRTQATKRRRSPVLGPTAALRGGVSCRVQQTRNGIRAAKRPSPPPGTNSHNNSYQFEGAPIEGGEVTSATARCPKALVILLESEDKLESSPIVVALKRARR